MKSERLRIGCGGRAVGSGGSHAQIHPSGIVLREHQEGCGQGAVRNRHLSIDWAVSGGARHNARSTRHVGDHQRKRFGAVKVCQGGRDLPCKRNSGDVADAVDVVVAHRVVVVLQGALRLHQANVVKVAAYTIARLRRSGLDGDGVIARGCKIETGTYSLPDQR